MSDSTSGEVLLSTLWTQNSEDGFQYNLYCPLDTRTGERSLVGCAALMHAQILYYWAEQGADISLSLTSSDAYVTSTRRIRITGEASSTYDYGVFSDITEQLETIQTGTQDIAALCYACGVLIQSDYTSDATSATMTTDVYERAGFDSYNLVSSSSNSLFFTTVSSGPFSSKSQITDAGWEVIAENLLAGRVIAVASGTLSHALCMDGYNAADGTYHLNFGWGADSVKEYSSSYRCYTGNGWYTIDELNALSISSLVIDIYPDYDGQAFLVTDTDEYGTGTLYRALEQAAAIQGETPVVDMDESMASQKISLETALPEIDGALDIRNLYGDIRIQASSGTGYGGLGGRSIAYALSVGTELSVENLSANLAAINSSSSIAALKSGTTLTIECLSGAVVANSMGTSYALYSGSSVDVTLKNGGIFAGKYTVTAASGESAITNIFTGLGNFTTSGTDALSKFDSCCTGYAVYSGNGDDAIALTDSSVLLGMLSLSGGVNSITVESGSYLHSYIMASDDSLALTLLLTECTDTPLVNLMDVTVTNYGRSVTYYGAESLAAAVNTSISVDVSAAQQGTHTLIANAGSDDITSLVFDLGGGIALSLGGTSQTDGYQLVLNDGDVQLVVAGDAPVGTPENLQACADALSWDGVSQATGYIVELSRDSFATAVQVETDGCEISMLALPEGTWEWRVKAANGSDWATGEAFTASAAEAASKLLQAQDDDADDVFFANATGTWDDGYIAEHQGVLDGWSGTGDWVSLDGKNRIQDVFSGADDDSILALTDDANGDALFLDDVYSAFPDGVAEPQARLANIQQILAGAGDDIVDLTSQTFRYSGEGLTIRGGDGDDTIWANTGDNCLFGDSGDDCLAGADGDDILVGGGGDDAMQGGGGDDIFCFCADWGEDTVAQLASGTVTLWFAENTGSWDEDTLTYTDGDNSVIVSGVESVTLKFGDDGSEQYASLSAAGAFEPCTSTVVYRAVGITA